MSLRTIRLDLNAMRSDQLGYAAPIIVTNKKYYSYEDAAYSITNSPLTSQDLGILQEVSHLLRQFKGFTHFNEVSEMVNKLEDKIYSEQHQQASVIDFEKNELLTGIKWLDVLYKAIINQTTLQLSYQSFKARQASNIIFYPYLLKEYRNRWFVLGLKKAGKEILTLVLDRIHAVEKADHQKFVLPKKFESSAYFADIIGITKNFGNRPGKVRFKASRQQAPYITTKPIHPSQKVEEELADGIVFSITVIPKL